VVVVPAGTTYGTTDDTTSATARGGCARVRVELPNRVVVATEVDPGEPVADVADRLARGLRRRGVQARRVGDGLQVTLGPGQSSELGGAS
jgi:hypothetical protein